MEGCSNCKYYTAILVGDKVNRSCARGRGVEMNEWWMNNGHSLPGKGTDRMSCHKFNNPNESLVKMDRLLGEVKDLLSKPEKS